MQTVAYLSKNELVLQNLKRQILDGTLKAGQVYSASKISEMLGVSKMPVNYAVLLLADQGFVTALPNVGFQVNAFNWDDIDELMQIKSALEKLALKRLLAKASADEIEKLAKSVDEIRQAILCNNKDEYMEATKKLYWGIPIVAGAKRCLDFYQKYWDYEVWFAMCIDEEQDVLLELCDSHDLLFAAIRKRDYKQCEKVADLHLQKSIALLKGYLGAAAFTKG